MKDYRIYLGLLLLRLLSPSTQAADPAYNHDLAKWSQVTLPQPTDESGRELFFLRANWSTHEWRVFLKDEQPCAQLTTESPVKPSPRPTFIPRAENFTRARTFARVDDGWLVGFNHGEFGAALYWFSPDGKQHYKISNHQVVDFMSLSNGIHAIEGLAHLSLSHGSAIRVTRANAAARWQATSVAKLPSAPYSVALRRNETMLITLSDSLISLSPNYKVQTLLTNANWDGLYANSSLPSPDERKLFIGMRQFVGEFDFTNKKFRFLIPSAQFLDKLPQEEEERFHKLHGP